jgi:hypothetical protein
MQFIKLAAAIILLTLPRLINSLLSCWDHLKIEHYFSMKALDVVRAIEAAI